MSAQRSSESIHSVSSSAITDYVLVEDRTTDPGPAGFFQHHPKYFFGDDEMFVEDKDGAHMKSRIQRNGIGRPAEVDALVLPVFDTPPAVTRQGVVVRHDWVLPLKGVEVRQSLSTDELSKMMSGSCVNQQAVEGRVAFLWGALDRVFIFRQAAMARTGVEVNDNCTIYAKLEYYALMIERALLMGQSLVRMEYNDFIEPVWANIALDNIGNLEDVENSLLRRSLMLVHNVDFVTADWPIVRMLSDPGNVLTWSAGTTPPHSAYLQWPEISMMVLARETPPTNFPTAVVPDAARIRQFCRTLADRRGEWPCYARGLYMAVELAGTRAQVFAGDVDHKPPLPPAIRFISQMMSPIVPVLPTVAETNPLFRFAGIYATDANDGMHEVEAYCALKPLRRLRATVLYNLLLSVGMTTVLHGLNISTGDLAAWSAGGTDMEPRDSLREVLSTHFRMRFNRPINAECFAMFQARKCVKLWRGCGIYTSLFPNNDWWHGEGLEPNSEVLLQGMNENIAPRFYNALALDSEFVIQKLPIEWGILGSLVKVDLSKEIQEIGLPEVKGWRSAKGDSSYRDRATSATPWKYVPYGAQVVHAITTALSSGDDKVPPFKVYPMNWYPTTDPSSVDLHVLKPVVVPGLSDVFMTALSSFPPMTFRTFSHSKSQVLSLGLSEDAFRIGNISDLRHWDKLLDRQAGFRKMPFEMVPDPYQAVSGEYGFMACMGKGKAL